MNQKSPQNSVTDPEIQEGRRSIISVLFS